MLKLSTFLKQLLIFFNFLLVVLSVDIPFFLRQNIESAVTSHLLDLINFKIMDKLKLAMQAIGVGKLQNIGAQSEEDQKWYNYNYPPRLNLIHYSLSGL